VATVAHGPDGRDASEGERGGVVVTLTEPTTERVSGTPSPLLDSPAELLQSSRSAVQTGDARTMRRTFALGAGLTALLMIAAIASGAFMLSRLTDAREQLLDDVGPAVLANQDLQTALLNQETGVRGFALTRRAEFLQPYRDGLVAEDAALALLRQHLTGRAGTAAQAEAVEAAARAWRTDYAEPVVAGGDPDPEIGKVRFDALRGPLDAMGSTLQAERAAARNGLNDAAAALRWVGIGIAVVMAAFLAAAAWGLRRGVLDPVADLADQVRAVVSGDMHREVRAAGPKEIVELGADVDAMRVHISRELDVLQEVNTRLDEQARDLERSNRDLEQFAYVASHDLQEPLRKVSSFCQLLQRRYGGKLDERADQYIEFAADGAQRMQRLINDLLAFSRVGRTTSGFEPVDLREIAMAAAAQLETTRGELDGQILVGELPQVRGDAALLRQLLLNLFGNGMKFHRPDVPPVVRIDAQRRDDHWEFAVTDNGIGVEPDYAEKIFVIFQRLHGRDVYAGTGIGLALVKKIVEFHSGRVWLDTAPREEPGTTIRFTLPVEDAADGDPATESTAQEQP
jgi:signal transduction histidine kinase